MSLTVLKLRLSQANMKHHEHSFEDTIATTIDGNDSFVDIDQVSSDDDSNPHHHNISHNHLSIQDNNSKDFELLADDDPEITTSRSSQSNHSLIRQHALLKEWEIINVDEIRAHRNVLDFGITAPKLFQPSLLLSEEQIKQILLELPARVHACNWNLTFSTENHGFSLNALYRRSIEQDSNSTSLLVVKDIEQNVFGAFLSSRVMISDGFYGTGESFLFTYYPTFKVFHWTHHNLFFIKGDLHSLGLGSGEGTYGLWLDGDLYHGRTCPSKTYDNDYLTRSEDFIVDNIELWSFVD